MVEIKSSDFVRINNGAHYEFMKVVSERFAAETTLSANATAKKAIEALAAAVKEEDRCLAISRKSLITDDIKAADDARDDIYSALRKTIKGFLKAPMADVAQAAKELNQCVADYRIDPAMQLDRETGLLHNFIADLETKYAAQVTKLGLTLFVAPLKEANAKVEQFIVGRTTAQSAVAAGELRKARLATDAAYRHLVKFVNALAMVSGTSDYDALAMFLNKHIDRYKQETLPAHKKGDKPGKDRPSNKKEKLQKEFDEKVAPLIAAFEQQEGLAAGSLKFAGKATGRGAERKYELAVAGSEKTIWVQVKGDHLVQVVSVKPKE